MQAFLLISGLELGFLGFGIIQHFKLRAEQQKIAEYQNSQSRQRGQQQFGRHVELVQRIDIEIGQFFICHDYCASGVAADASPLGVGSTVSASVAAGALSFNETFKVKS